MTTTAPSNTRIHDPLTCGLDDATTCDDCRALFAMAEEPHAIPPHLSVRVELQHILDQFDAADSRLRQAHTQVDSDAAEKARREAWGQMLAADFALADLLVLLLRKAVERRPEALRALLTEVLRPDLDPIIDAITHLEEDRR